MNCLENRPLADADEDSRPILMPLSTLQPAGLTCKGTMLEHLKTSVMKTWRGELSAPPAGRPGGSSFPLHVSWGVTEEVNWIYASLEIVMGGRGSRLLLLLSLPR
jgi:hypothetical protein